MYKAQWKSWNRRESKKPMPVSFEDFQNRKDLFTALRTKDFDLAERLSLKDPGLSFALFIEKAPEYKISTPMTHCLETKNSEGIELLLKCGAEIPPCAFCRDGDPFMVSKWIKEVSPDTLMESFYDGVPIKEIFARGHEGLLIESLKRLGNLMSQEHIRDMIMDTHPTLGMVKGLCSSGLADSSTLTCALRRVLRKRGQVRFEREEDPMKDMSELLIEYGANLLDEEVLTSMPSIKKRPADSNSHLWLFLKEALMEKNSEEESKAGALILKAALSERDVWWLKKALKMTKVEESAWKSLSKVRSEDDMKKRLECANVLSKKVRMPETLSKWWDEHFIEHFNNNLILGTVEAEAKIFKKEAKECERVCKRRI